jgi:hypothetical protein
MCYKFDLKAMSAANQNLCQIKFSITIVIRMGMCLPKLNSSNAYLPDLQ